MFRWPLSRPVGQAPSLRRPRMPPVLSASPDQLAKTDPHKKFFPDYGVSLRDSLTKETDLFLLSQSREDRDPVEL